jgi:carnitine monooxygenase subunit
VIGHALTEFGLPPRCYSDLEVLAREHERIFRRSWAYVGHVGQVENPGDHLVANVAGVPIVVVRGKDGAARGFLNVCRHRGHPVAMVQEPEERVPVGGGWLRQVGNGTRSTLQCIYHAWTYGLDGCLRAAPRSDREADFDKAQLGLVPISVELWGPMVFANLRPDAQPLSTFLGGVARRTRERGFEVDDKTYKTTMERVVRCNWKEFLENGAECYHCPTIHRFDAITVHPDNYRLELGDNWVGQAGFQSATPFVYDYFYYLCFPTFSWAQHGDSFHAIEMVPVDEHHTLQRFDVFGPAAMTIDEARSEMIEFSPINEEDVAVVERIHATNRAVGDLMPAPRLLPDSEKQIQHMHAIYLRMMGWNRSGCP